MPGAYETYVTGVEGDMIVGNCFTGHYSRGFSYDGQNWTWIDKPDGGYTVVRGISGNKILVG